MQQLKGDFCIQRSGRNVEHVFGEQQKIKVRKQELATGLIYEVKMRGVNRLVPEPCAIKTHFLNVSNDVVLC
jgi:hypothetical protein